MEQSGQRKHILIIPFPAFGHWIPMLEFAKRAIHHHDVTITYSASRINELETRKCLPPAPIRILPVDDNVTHSLDHLTDLKQIGSLMASTEPFYSKFARDLPEGCGGPVDAVVCDNSLYATFQPMAKNGTVKVYSFSCFPVTLMAQQSMVTEDVPIVSDEEFLRTQAAGQPAGIPESLRAMTFKMNESMKYMSTIISSSFEEMEPRAAALLRIMRKNLDVKFVGPLLPLTEDHPDEMVRKWLDGKGERSVVYFSFGTIALVSAEQIAEIYEALSSLKRPFIWSLRPAQQELLSESVPRTTEDHLILPWVPQKQVLGHKSTGVFLSHCGWNSTLEALSYGIPIAAWPSFGDQQPNAQMVERLNAGTLVEGAGNRGTFVKAVGIVTAIEKAAGWNGHSDKCVLVAKELGKQAHAAVMPEGKSMKNTLDILKEI